MSYTDIEKIKQRIREVAMVNSIDREARIERLAIEKVLMESPYKSHLYTEQQFEHLIFLELLEVNANLTRLINILSSDAQEGTCIEGSCKGHTSHATNTNTGIKEVCECNGDDPTRKRRRPKTANRG